MDKQRASVLVAVSAILLLGLYFTFWQNSGSQIRHQSTISECGPGEDPRTTLCYDPDLPR